jgi:hypothetical protein
MPAAQETGGCRRKGVISDPGSFGRRAQTAEPMSQGVRPRLGIGVQDGECDIGEDVRPYFFSFFFTCDLDACCSSRIISLHEESHFPLAVPPDKSRKSTTRPITCPIGAAASLPLEPVAWDSL